MRLALRSAPLLLALAACGGPPVPLVVEPDATLPPPRSTVTPPPSPFNGALKIVITSDRPATIYASLDGSDPRFSAQGRIAGPSPLELALDRTTTVKWFASVGGKDEELREGEWIRAGGPKGTISGVVVVGSIAVGKDVGVRRNFELQRLGSIPAKGEIPFVFEGVQSGTHRLSAQADRNGDGQLVPFVDLTSDTVAVTIDLSDPFKASAEDVRLYVGASQTGLGSIKGTITLPEPPPGQTLRVSALDSGAFGSAGDPTAMLQQLQAGDQVFTATGTTQYPYAIPNLNPGRYVPVPALLGLGSGGLAVNFVANPLQPVTVQADQESIADFAFGGVAIAGTVTWNPAVPPQGLAWGVVAARSVSLLQGMQVVLMPTVFVQAQNPGPWTGGFGGQALREGATFSLRAFPAEPQKNPLTEALTWALNPFAPLPAQATVTLGTADQTVNFTIP